MKINIAVHCAMTLCNLEDEIPSFRRNVPARSDDHNIELIDSFTIHFAALSPLKVQ
jgi:hypothetical protein